MLQDLESRATLDVLGNPNAVEIAFVVCGSRRYGSRCPGQAAVFERVEVLDVSLEVGNGHVFGNRRAERALEVRRTYVEALQSSGRVVFPGSELRHGSTLRELTQADVQP